MTLALLGISSIFAIIIVIQFGRAQDLEEKLDNEIQHSLALEKTINDYLK